VTEGPQQSLTLPDLSTYEDFSPYLAQDGQKAAFISRRDAGNYRVYLYDEALEGKRVLLADRLSLKPEEQEWTAALRSDAGWLAVYRAGPQGRAILLSDWSGQQSATIPVAAEARVLGVSLAPTAGINALAIVERVGVRDRVSVYTYDVVNGVVSASLSERFEGEQQAQFALGVQGQLRLFTSSATGRKVRSWSGSGWALDSSELALGAQDLKRRGSASAIGYLQAKSLNSVRTKKKLGTLTNKPQGYVDEVGVVDELVHFAPFGTTPLDFSIGNYRTYEPSVISTVSASTDGAYVLVTGGDTYFCKSRGQFFNVLLLVRTSDMSTVPVFMTRDIGKKSWTEITTDPCSVYDAAELASKKEFDLRIAGAQLIAVDGDRFTLLYESTLTGEREIRRATFKVESWTDRTVSGVTITDLSANSPP
jgi:hypothetical protein